MSASSSALPSTGVGTSEDPGIPTLAEVRSALRSPDVPLPPPRTVLDAAHRVQDLVQVDRFSEARFVARSSLHREAPMEHRVALLTSRVTCHAARGDIASWTESAADLIDALRESGHPEHAEAMALVIAEQIARRRRDGGPRSLSSSYSATDGTSARGSGRRRGAGSEVSADLVTVVRGEMAVRPQDEVDAGEATRALRRALDALPRVRFLLLGDPEMTLRVRYAQALEGAGDRQGATRQALDVLDHAQEATFDGDELVDLQRARTSAHAVLSRTLSDSRPLDAVRHALEALRSLRHVDDPVLRVGIITALLRALMRAELADHASFVSGRLAALQRSIRRDAHRIQPLLAVATQRIVAQRLDAAIVPLEEIRRIAVEQRDRLAAMEASRLFARVHQLSGRAPEAMVELRRMAADARWLADDLDTASGDRAVYIQDEVKAQALVLRHALDLGDRRVAEGAAAAMERRTRPSAAPQELPVALMWDYRVDARVGRVIAAGIGLSRGDEDVKPADYEGLRHEAVRIIGEVPEGHEERARYWAAYLDDRHAAMLADRGEDRRALRAAQRALNGWDHLGRDEDAARLREQIARLQG